MPTPERDDGHDDGADFQRLRPLLFSIAYRMTGSVADAEDIVSEAFLRVQTSVDTASVESMKAYLSTMVTRLSIDHLRSARVRREQYVGFWLPEPIPGDAAPPDAAAHAELSESLSVAFLVVLESLSPVERAVFLLHDVFDFSYREVSRIVDKTEDNSRQIATRARKAVSARRPRFEPSEEERNRLADSFFRAIELGDVESLVDLLADDVIAYGDGGDRGPSFRRPIVGIVAVRRMLSAVSTVLTRFDLRIEPTLINRQPGALVRDTEGKLLNVLTVDIVDGQIATVYSILNPDKLRHLAPLIPETHPLRGGRHPR